jgi:hypothetical protein
MDKKFDVWWRIWGNALVADMGLDAEKAKDLAYRSWVASSLPASDLEKHGNMSAAEMLTYMQYKKMGKTVIVNNGKIVGYQG